MFHLKSFPPSHTKQKLASFEYFHLSTKKGFAIKRNMQWKFSNKNDWNIVLSKKNEKGVSLIYGPIYQSPISQNLKISNTINRQSPNVA